MRIPRAAFGVLFVVFIAVGPRSACAAVTLGVGVDVGKIAVDDTLTPGGTYTLPSLGVINTGSTPTSYTIGVESLKDQGERIVPPSWLSFEPGVLRLRGGERRRVGVKLSLPDTAAPGRYFALLAAETIMPAGMTAIGPSAATKLSFTVKSPPKPREGRLLQGGLEGALIAAAVLLLILLGRWLSTSFSIVRRKT